VKIAKAIMAPSLGRVTKKKKASGTQENQPVARLSEKEHEARKLLKALREHVVKNAEHVGEQFPKLARQMHHEEIEARSIYGNAKPEEVRELLEEGIEVAPLPVLPDERN
jgi:hypothetical protein